MHVYMCVCVCVCVRPWDHKTSHKGKFFEIEIYTSHESWINKLSIEYGLLG